MKSRKYKSVLSLKAIITQSIDEGDIDQSLRLISDYIERIITEPLCTSLVIDSKAMDELCQSIGKTSLAKIHQQGVDVNHDKKDRPIYVYIVTKLQKSGGHTRVIEDFIGTLPDEQHVILSTELAGKSDVGYLDNRLAQKNQVTFEQAPKVNYQERLKWLQLRLLALQPKKVYLFNHHQDSVAVAAIQPEMDFDATFYHHGDHHLCLGVHLPHLQHIDFHATGYRYCRDKLGINNTYIPLTLEDKGKRPADWSFLNNDVLITCTAAKSNKIEVPYYVSYLDLVPQLLQATGGKHIHIGRLTPWALYKIRRGLKRYHIQPDRFIYTPWVPSVWKALHDYRVDLYVASFPYGGGLTLIEAMGAGIPVALHNHIFSRVLSSIDLAYPGVFNWRSPDELLDYSANVTSSDLEVAGHLGRIQFESFHTEENLHRVLYGGEGDRLQPNDLTDPFSIDNDERLLWIEQQLTVKRVFTRTVYRMFRRLRTWL